MDNGELQKKQEVIGSKEEGNFKNTVKSRRIISIGLIFSLYSTFSSAILAKSRDH